MGDRGGGGGGGEKRSERKGSQEMQVKNRTSSELQGAEKISGSTTDHREQ